MANKNEKAVEKTEKTVKEKKEPVVHKKPAPREVEDKPGFKGIVRIAGKDIRGHIKLKKALSYVRGIGPTLSNSVSNLLTRQLNIASDIEVGYLTDDMIEKVDKILFALHEYDIPRYLLNRRGDFIEGSDKHAVMNDLIFYSKQDVEREKKLFSWKGYRHYYGQKVRGQRTRNTGRTGMAVGVLRKSIIAAAASAAAGAAPAKGASAPAGGAAPAAGAAKAAPAGGAAAKPAAPKAEAKK